jgi:hypothetical protein
VGDGGTCARGRAPGSQGDGGGRSAVGVGMERLLSAGCVEQSGRRQAAEEPAVWRRRPRWAAGEPGASA